MYYFGGGLGVSGVEGASFYLTNAVSAENVFFGGMVGGGGGFPLYFTLQRRSRRHSCMS